MGQPRSNMRDASRRQDAGPHAGGSSTTSRAYAGLPAGLRAAEAGPDLPMKRSADPSERESERSFSRHRSRV